MAQLARGPRLGQPWMKGFVCVKRADELNQEALGQAHVCFAAQQSCHVVLLAAGAARWSGFVGVFKISLRPECGTWRAGDLELCRKVHKYDHERFDGSH